MRHECVLGIMLRIALNLWAHQLIGSIPPRVSSAERLTMIDVVRPIADRHPADRFTSLVVEISGFKIGRDRITSAQFTSLEELAVSNHAARTVDFACCLALSFKYPLAPGMHLWNDTASIAVPVTLKQSRDLLHVCNLQSSRYSNVPLARVPHRIASRSRIGSLTNPGSRLENIAIYF